MARKTGLSRPTIDALIERLKKGYGPVMGQLEEVKTAELLGLVSHNARRALAVSDEDFERASLRDKAVAAGIYIDKRQMLSGEPTHVISHEDRRKLPELILAFMKEAKRRGIALPEGFRPPPPVEVEAEVVSDPARGAAR